MIVSVSRVIPDGVKPSIKGYRNCPKPMPFARVHRIIIDLLRGAKGPAAVGTAHKHHVGSTAAVWHYAAKHVNIVFRRTAGMIDREEDHSIQSVWIDPAKPEEATHVH